LPEEEVPDFAATAEKVEKSFSVSLEPQFWQACFPLRPAFSKKVVT